MTLQQLITELAKRIPSLSTLDTTEHIENVRTKYLLQLSDGRDRDGRRARIMRIAKRPPVAQRSSGRR